MSHFPQNIKNRKLEHPPCAAAILAGGCNSRMQGQNKAFLRVNGRTILDRAIDALDGFFDEIMIIGNDPLAYMDYGLPVYSDVFASRSSSNGVFSAITYAACAHVFVAPCDLPFLKKDMVALLLDELEPNADVVIPRTAMGLEPLCAIYSKQCAKPARRMLEANRLSVRDFFPQVHVKEVPEERLREADPELVSFFNVNTSEDFKKAKKGIL